MKYCGVVTDKSYTNAVLEYAGNKLRAVGTVYFAIDESRILNCEIHETISFKLLEKCIEGGM